MLDDSAELVWGFGQMNATPSPASSPPPDLEIKDAQLIFNRVWKGLEDSIGREELHFPKELILLGGAPGSGKGTNTDFIRKVRGITAQPIVISYWTNVLLSPLQPIAMKP